MVVGATLAIVSLASAGYEYYQENEAADEARENSREQSRQLVKQAGSEAKALSESGRRIESAQKAAIASNGIASTSPLASILTNENAARTIFETNRVLSGASAAESALLRQGRIESQVRKQRANAGLLTAGVSFVSSLDSDGLLGSSRQTTAPAYSFGRGGLNA